MIRLLSAVVIATAALSACEKPDGPPSPDRLVSANAASVSNPHQHLRDKATVAYQAGRYQEAFGFYKAAGEHGDALSQTMVSVMYGQGKGVARDYAAAATWARMSAEQGEANGQAMLAVLLAEGQGVPRNPVEAYMWASLSVAGGGGPPAVQTRDRLAARMTAGQIAEAQRMAREWRRR